MLSRCRKFVAGAVLGLLLVVAAAPASALTFPGLTAVSSTMPEFSTRRPRPCSSRSCPRSRPRPVARSSSSRSNREGTSIEDYGYQLGRHWKIGQKDTNTGALLIVAPNERKVRIEVGYGFEGKLTDAVSKLIIENSVIPRFRANDFAGGIGRGVDDIIQAVSVNSEEWKARAKQPGQPTRSGRCLDISVLHGRFLHDRGQRHTPGPRARECRSGGATWLTWADHRAVSGLVVVFSDSSWSTPPVASRVVAVRSGGGGASGSW